MERRAALDVALDMVQRPLLARQSQSQPLPDDVLQLIRIAAQSEEDIAWASRTRARSSGEVRDAAVMFLQQVLFHPRADSLRVMGLGPAATIEDLHEHRKWLLKWLHPDRNPNKWESQLFKRVVDASGEVQELLKSQARLVPPTAVVQRPRRRSRRHSLRHRMTQDGHRKAAGSGRSRRIIRRGSYAVLTVAILAIGWQLWSGQSLAEFPVVRSVWMDW
ncbi:MAG: J domain-containing protein [Rhizobiales bacterium]|nr:J domain-containing protein [Hyphomicrobiales bacterium]